MEGIVRLMLLALSALRPAERLSAGASRITTAAMFTAAAVLALAIGFCCLIAAAWIALIPVVGAVSAALIAGACFILLAAFMWLLARARIADDHPHHKETHHDPLEMIAELFGGTTGADVKRLIGENKVPLLLAALVAGLTIGNGRRRR